MTPTIEYDKKKNFGLVPRIKVKKGEKWIMHVHSDGARFHVLHWGMNWKGEVVVQCSEPDCIYNKP